MAHSPSHSVAFLRFRVTSSAPHFAFAACLFALTASFFASTAAHGAEVTLLDGRVWEGIIVRETKDTIVLETVGGEIEISHRGILRIDRKPTRRQRYERKLAALDKTDPDQHYLLALWCRRQRLSREAEYHLNYAVGLEPDHAGARRALGEVKYNDKWMPEKEAKEAQGLRFYAGRWMTREAAEIAEAEDLRRELKKELRRQVRALADIVARPRSEKAGLRARRRLLTFRDPLAYDALLELVRHSNVEVRIIGIRLADKLDLPGADREILLHALYDGDPSVRDQARRALEGRWSHAMLSETLKALKSRDKPIVRFAAALVLGIAKDPATIDDLIDALYVTYRVKRTGEAGPPPIGLTAHHVVRPPVQVLPGGVWFDPAAGVVAGRSWKPVDAPDRPGYAYIINYAALDALRAITHQDFGVNKRAWRKWWADNRDDFVMWKEIK